MDISLWCQYHGRSSRILFYLTCTCRHTQSLSFSRQYRVEWCLSHPPPQPALPGGSERGGGWLVPAQTGTAEEIQVHKYSVRRNARGQPPLPSRRILLWGSRSYKNLERLIRAPTTLSLPTQVTALVCTNFQKAWPALYRRRGIAAAYRIQRGQHVSCYSQVGKTCKTCPNCIFIITLFLCTMVTGCNCK